MGNKHRTVYRSSVCPETSAVTRMWVENGLKTVCKHAAPASPTWPAACWLLTENASFSLCPSVLLSRVKIGLSRH